MIDPLPLSSMTVCMPSYQLLANGMTLRDHFAGLAMQGFAADPDAVWPNGVSDMAVCAYRWADAMIEARSNK